MQYTDNEFWVRTFLIRISIKLNQIIQLENRWKLCHKKFVSFVIWEKSIVKFQKKMFNAPFDDPSKNGVERLFNIHTIRGRANVSFFCWRLSDLWVQVFT